MLTLTVSFRRLRAPPPGASTPTAFGPSDLAGIAIDGRLLGMLSKESETYRSVIDTLVRDCLHGQGEIGREREAVGVRRAEATSDWGTIRES